MKDKILKWYKLGLWTKDMVHNAVIKGILNIDEADEIIKEKEE